MSDDLFPGFESHWIDTPAGRIFARSKGDGPPLVLLHGSYMNIPLNWSTFIPLLAKDRKVIVTELQGHELTQWVTF